MTTFDAQKSLIGPALANARSVVRPRPGFYVLRLARGRPLVPALIFQCCPMVVPQPARVQGPHPDDWCRPLDRSPRYQALIDGRPASVERVWFSRSLRAVNAAEYRFRLGPLRHWAHSHAEAPEAQPSRRINLSLLPPLF